MQITVNGEIREVPQGATVAWLIGELKLAGKPCAAEVNRQVVPRRDHEARALSEGDRVELVTLVGGG